MKKKTERSYGRKKHHAHHPNPNNRSGQVFYDWDALKAEWMAGNETLNAFRIRKNIINQGWFYRKAEEGKWELERQKIASKALEKTSEKLSEQLSDEWVNQRQLWKGVEALAGELMKKAVKVTSNPDGSQSKTVTITPEELSSLSTAIEKALKNRKLMAGEATERIEERSLHMHIVGMIEKIERKNAAESERLNSES